MKSNLLFLCAVMMVMPAFTKRWPQTTSSPGGSGVNLNGKMFTMTQYGGGLRFYSPYMPPPWSSSTPSSDTSTEPTTSFTSAYMTPKTKQTTTRPTTTKYTTTRPTTTRPTTTPWTTAPSTRGVTVCLRYITDASSPSIFTLSPSSTPMTLYASGPLSYSLSFYGYSSLSLRPYIPLWPHMRQNMWTSICVTVDNVKNVAQMFCNSNMSIRKLLSSKHTWSGEPVIDFPGFDGQVTDVNVWDYPLSYKEVLYYMSAGFYGSYQGSVLNWSYISYSVRGQTLLEENYEDQMKASSRGARGRRLKGEKMTRKAFNVMTRSRKQLM